MEIYNVCVCQKALDWIAKKVVGPVLPEDRVGIGIGNWSQVDGVVKGHPKATSNELKNHCPNMQR